MENKKLVPEIRFPEFDGEWNKETLKNCLCHKSKRNKNLEINNVLSVSNTKGFISQKDQFDRDNVASTNLSNYKIVEKGDIAYNPSRINVGSIAVLDKFESGIISPMYVVFNTNNVLSTIYFNNLLKTHRFKFLIKSNCSGSVRDSLNFDDLCSFKVSIPSLPEQQKIATFLSSVDKRISLLENKHTQLKLYKKALMQKLFSQEIRFRDDDGREYPEWEEKSFRDIFTTIPTKKYQIKTSEISNKGSYPVIDQGNGIIAGYSDSKEKVFKCNQIIVYGDHTTTVKYIEFDFVIGADGTKLLSSKNNILKYLYYNLCYNNVEQQGYKRHFSILKDVKINIPCLQEQQKIANILSAIDKKIELTANKLEQTKQFKKSLLQKMFV